MNLWNRRIKWMLLSIPLCPRSGRSVILIIMFGGMGFGYPLLSFYSEDSPLMMAAMIGVFFVHIVLGAIIGRVLDAVFGSKSIIQALQEDGRR